MQAVCSVLFGLGDGCYTTGEMLCTPFAGCQSAAMTTSLSLRMEGLLLTSTARGGGAGEREWAGERGSGHAPLSEVCVVFFRFTIPFILADTLSASLEIDVSIFGPPASRARLFER